MAPADSPCREQQRAGSPPLRPYWQALLFIGRLHAKIDVSDYAAVLTSMDLVEPSAFDTMTFAVPMTKAGDRDGAQHTLASANR